MLNVLRSRGVRFCPLLIRPPISTVGRHATLCAAMAAKRKRSSVAATPTVTTNGLAPANGAFTPPPPQDQLSRRKASARGAGKSSTNPNKNGDIMDAPDALRASPDSDINEGITPGRVKMQEDSESPLSEVPEMEPPKKNGASAATKTATATPAKSKPKAKVNDDVAQDPEADGDEEADESEIQEASMRPPPVNSSYLPLPWKGRLGYVCRPLY